MAKKSMTEKLQDNKAWEDEAVEVQPAKNRRAIVSVAFSRDEFVRVAEAAKSANKKTSEFIREAALAFSNVSMLTTASMHWTSFGVLSGTAYLPQENMTETPTKAQFTLEQVA